MIANRPTHVRAPINPYNPKPTSAQLQSRAKYQEAVDAVATLNSRETRAHLQQQTDRQRFDSSINVFADSSNSNWKSVPVAPPKQSFDLNSGRRSVDPVVVDLGFERPPSSNHDGVDLHTFHHDTKQRHNSLMCTINLFENHPAPSNRTRKPTKCVTKPTKHRWTNASKHWNTPAKIVSTKK
jgi:hypothetical protein